ncbi:MAG TPA: hypothetical protein VMF31_10490 [Solirubrobacterales bacterium]|nr:hypothetical protein [Solirubrobacterales bacterium]
MAKKARDADVIPLLYNRKQAAKALGDMSIDHFERHVQAELPCVYSGQLRMYRPQDLTDWIKRNLSSPGESRAA